MTEFEAKSVIDAINRMFKGGTFSICTVKECMDITGAIETSDIKVLHLYHCVKFSDMDSETKAMLFKATLKNVCNVDEFPEIQMVKPSDEIKNTFAIEHKEKPLMKRLFGSRI